MAYKMPINMSVKERAQTVAAHLLEDDQFNRVCAACEKEFGRVPDVPGKPKSHGMCKRHTLEYYKDDVPPAVLQKLLARPDSDFAPDLAQRRTSA